MKMSIFIVSWLLVLCAVSSLGGSPLFAVAATQPTVGYCVAPLVHDKKCEGCRAVSQVSGLLPLPSAAPVAAAHSAVRLTRSCSADDSGSSCDGADASLCSHTAPQLACIEPVASPVEPVASPVAAAGAMSSEVAITHLVHRVDQALFHTIEMNEAHISLSVSLILRSVLNEDIKRQQRLIFVTDEAVQSFVWSESKA